MKKFFLKITLFFILTGIGYWLFYAIFLPFLVLKSGDTKIKRWKDFYAIPTNADLVIIGSSRVYRGFDPKVIEAITGKKTEVIASIGVILNFVEPFFLDYLKVNKVPETVVIQLDATLSTKFLLKRAYLSAGIYQLPSYPDNSYIFNRQYLFADNRFNDINHFVISRYFRSFCYFYYHFDYYKIVMAPDKWPNIQGFQPCDCTWKSYYDEYITKKHYVKWDFDTLLTKSILNQAITTMRTKGVKRIILTDSPYYRNMLRDVQNYALWSKFLRHFSIDQKVDFIDFNNGSYKLAQNTEYYYNPGHLNHQGAYYFSLDFADSCKQILKENSTLYSK